MDSEIFEEPLSNIEKTTVIKNTATIDETKPKIVEKETEKPKEIRKVKKLDLETLQEALPSLLSSTSKFSTMENRDEFKLLDDFLQQYKNWAAYHWPDKHPDDTFSIIKRFSKSRKMREYLDRLKRADIN